MVELSLVLTVLGMIFAGIIDFSRVFHAAVTIADSARAGAQFAAQTNATTGADDLIRIIVKQDAVDVPGTVTVTPDRICKCQDQSVVNCVTGSCIEGAVEIYVRVKSEAVFNTMMNFPGIPSTVPLSQTAIFRVQ